MTETISRTDEGQPKYIFYKFGTNIYFLYSKRFGPLSTPKIEKLFKSQINFKNNGYCRFNHFMNIGECLNYLT